MALAGGGEAMFSSVALADAACSRFVLLISVFFDVAKLAGGGEVVLSSVVAADASVFTLALLLAGFSALTIIPWL